MIYISIGVDCGIAEMLKKYNLRFKSYPFDWTVTYNGVSDYFKNNFNNYLPNNNEDYKNKYYNNTYFIHNNFPDDLDTMKRRLLRTIELLNSDNEIIFIRKGHFEYHHKEALNNNCNIKNEIEDCEELCNILSIKYPKLKFKIILFLMCCNCYNINNIYNVNKNIILYNLSYIENDHKIKYENIINIFGKLLENNNNNN